MKIAAFNWILWLNDWLVCLWASALAFCSHLLAWKLTCCGACVCAHTFWCVFAVRMEGCSEVVSCIFSQRLKQRRDDVTAFSECCCCDWSWAGIIWKLNDEWPRFSLLSQPFWQAHTYTHFTVKHPELQLLTGFQCPELVDSRRGQFRRVDTRWEVWNDRNLKWKASVSEVFGLKNTWFFVFFFLSLLMRTISAVFGLPHHAGCPPTMLHLGVGVTGVLLQICAVLCSLKWERCPDHLNPHQGRSPCFIGRMGGN